MEVSDVYSKVLVCFFLGILSFSSAIAITEKEVVAAIKNGKLGDCLLDNSEGAEQLIRHCKKHFCSWGHINDNSANTAAQNHTTLGAGRIACQYAIRCILNSVDPKDGYDLQQDTGNPNIVRLKVKNLKVKDVNKSYKSAWRVLYVSPEAKGQKRTKKKAQHVLNSRIACQINFVKNGGSWNINTNNSSDGTAGYCYVVAQ